MRYRLDDLEGRPAFRLQFDRRHRLGNERPVENQVDLEHLRLDRIKFRLGLRRLGLGLGGHFRRFFRRFGLFSLLFRLGLLLRLSLLLRFGLLLGCRRVNLVFGWLIRPPRTGSGNRQQRPACNEVGNVSHSSGSKSRRKSEGPVAGIRRSAGLNAFDADQTIVHCPTGPWPAIFSQ